MNVDERRKKIINIRASSKSPVAGVALAKELDVSRQVIVQDIALLRACLLYTSQDPSPPQVMSLSLSQPTPCHSRSGRPLRYPQKSCRNQTAL